MRSILAAALVVLASSSMLHAETRLSIPRRLGDAIHLGMTKDSFAKRFNIEPTRCASCYHGELLAQPTIQESPDVVRDLAALGLSMGTAPKQIDLFFEHGKLATIHVEELKAANAEEVLARQFGKGSGVEKSNELTETEWSDSRTRLRLTKWESEYQLTLSDRSAKTKPVKKKP